MQVNDCCGIVFKLINKNVGEFHCATTARPAHDPCDESYTTNDWLWQSRLPGPRLSDAPSSCIGSSLVRCGVKLRAQSTSWKQGRPVAGFGGGDCGEFLNEGLVERTLGRSQLGLEARDRAAGARAH